MTGRMRVRRVKWGDPYRFMRRDPDRPLPQALATVRRAEQQRRQIVGAQRDVAGRGRVLLYHKQAICQRRPIASVTTTEADCLWAYGDGAAPFNLSRLA